MPARPGSAAPAARARADRGRWRSERWDSFTLLSPNWQTRRPGHRYVGPDPDGFMGGADVADLLQVYGREAPVRTGVTVDAVQPAARGWWVLTSVGVHLATHVVVATGDLDRPAVPTLARDLPPRIAQLHTSAYRNPAQLAPGGVLVVGAGPSGQQIADELARGGRDVHIAVGRHKSLPRRYRNRDAYWWMDRMGTLDRTVDSLPHYRAGHRSPNAVLTGGQRGPHRRREVPDPPGDQAGGGRRDVAGPKAWRADANTKPAPATTADAATNHRETELPFAVSGA